MKRLSKLGLVIILILGLMIPASVMPTFITPAMAATTATLAPQVKFTALDSNGDPYVGGKLYTFNTGTTTGKTSWTDSTKATSNTNPIILDSRGQADVWIDSSGGAYRFRLDNPDDITIWTKDNINEWNADIQTAIAAIGSIYGMLTLPTKADSLITYDDSASEIKRLAILNLLGNVNYPDYNEADQGLTGSGSSVKTFVDTIGADSATLVFRHNSGAATTTYTFSTDETIPSNINVVIEKGAFLYRSPVAPSAVAFTGAGLNDATSGGLYTGSSAKNYRVEIDATGAPDTFKWSNDGGTTWKATGVGITGAAQALEEGVTITFNATTGHTVADRWDFTVDPIELTINGPFEAGLYQVFSGAGKVSFGCSMISHPRWWHSTADWGLSISKAVSSIRNVGGVIELEGGVLECTTPINMTGLTKGFALRGYAGSATGAAGNPNIKFKHTGVGIDCTASPNLIFRDFGLDTDDTDYPKVGILLARNDGGGSVGQSNFYNIITDFHAKFSVAPVYSYGSEENNYFGCIFINTIADTNTFVSTTTNLDSIASTFETIATGTQSNSVTNLYGCVLKARGGAGTANFVLNSSPDFHVYGGFWAAGSATKDGKCYVHVIGDAGASNHVSFSGIRTEPGTYTVTDGFVFTSTAAVTHANWSIKDTSLLDKEKAIKMDANSSMQQLTYENVAADVGTLAFGKDLKFSNIDTMGNAISVAGTSMKNHIKGDLSAITLAARDRDIIEDTEHGWLDSSQSSFKIGTFTYDTAAATGTVDTTGIGFKPRLVEFMAVIDGQSSSFGNDDGTAHYCLYWVVAVGKFGPAGTRSIYIEKAAADYATGYISAFLADGFTVSWTKFGAAAGTATIYYRAYRQ